MNQIEKKILVLISIDVFISTVRGGKIGHDSWT